MLLGKKTCIYTIKIGMPLYCLFRLIHLHFEFRSKIKKGSI